MARNGCKGSQTERHSGWHTSAPVKSIRWTNGTENGLKEERATQANWECKSARVLAASPLLFFPFFSPLLFSSSANALLPIDGTDAHSLLLMWSTSLFFGTMFAAQFFNTQRQMAATPEFSRFSFAVAANAANLIAYKRTVRDYQHDTTTMPLR